MKYNKTLIAGPWVGEFGWELFAWQAYIRSLSRSYDKTIVISRENSKPLYEDFCNQFISYNPVGGLADSFFMYDLDIKKEFRKIITDNNVVLDKNTTVLFPRRIGFPPATHFSEAIDFGKLSIAPEYIKFGEEQNKKYDYIFHIRSRQLRQEDNWSLENWSSLKQMLNSDKIACIGTKKESGWIEGTDDLRDLNLGDLFSVLRNSDFVFGPSSGPMHLSSLCGVPHIVWSISNNKVRYEENWNPLRTKILFLDEYSWHPSAEYVYNKFVNWKSKHE